MKQHSTHNRILPWFICGIAALFYCYNYFLRVSPSVMIPDLSEHFDITAKQLGALSAFYYYAYVPMQLPVGIILDRFGARVVLFFASLMCVLGLGCFMMADGYAGAALGRFMIGFGAAFSYLTVLKLATLWMAPNRFALVAGLTTSMGMVAAVASKKYLAILVENIGYRDALFSTFLIGFILCTTILFMVRDRPNQPVTEITDDSHLSFPELRNTITRFIFNPQMWLIGLVGLLLYLPASVFLDLWDVEYLKTVYGLTASEAASAAIMMFVGWIIASPIIGACSDSIRRRQLPLLIATTIAFIANCIIFYGPHLQTSTLYTLLFIFGMCCGSHPLCFSLSKENNPLKISATATAATNTIIMSGGVIFQPLVGMLLDWHSVGIKIAGKQVYTSYDYTWALSVIPIALFISIILTVFIKETHCEMKEYKDEYTDTDSESGDEETPLLQPV